MVAFHLRHEVKECSPDESFLLMIYLVPVFALKVVYDESYAASYKESCRIIIKRTQLRCVSFGTFRVVLHLKFTFL